MLVFVFVSLLAAPWAPGPGSSGQVVHTGLHPGPLPRLPSSFPGSSKGTGQLPGGWHARLSLREAGTMELIKPTWTQGPGTRGPAFSHPLQPELRRAGMN